MKTAMTKTTHVMKVKVLAKATHNCDCNEDPACDEDKSKDYDNGHDGLQGENGTWRSVIMTMRAQGAPTLVTTILHTCSYRIYKTKIYLLLQLLPQKCYICFLQYMARKPHK